jgi:hypothetical protein
MENVLIDGFNYMIKPIKFDLSKLDDEGRCYEYCNKSYVFKDFETGKIKVRNISYFNDDNNHHDAFDPLNYNEDNVFLILSHGDEFWDLKSIFEIVWTDNVTGFISTDWGVDEVLEDLILKSKSKP